MGGGGWAVTAEDTEMKPFPSNYVQCRAASERERIGGTKRLVSVNICSVEVNSAGIFFSTVLRGIFVIKVK